MISLLRRIVGSKIGAGLALAFLVLVAFAFAAGDVSNTGGFGSLSSLVGGSSTTVGERSITETELQSRVQRTFEQQRRENPGLTINQFLAAGAVPGIYDQLVASLSLNEFGAKEGVHVSKRMVDAEIAKIPAFQDASGRFSQNAFRQLLSSQGVSEEALRADIEQQLVGSMLVTPTGFGTHLTDSMVLPYASLLLETRVGEIAAIPSLAFMPLAQPTDAQLKRYYKSNADRYTIPEQRRMRYAIVDQNRFDAAAMPTDGEIAKYYADNKNRYAARETRTIDQLILPSESAAKEAAKAPSLAAAAKANELSVATFKDTTKTAYVDVSSKAAADMVFAATRGKILGPVKLALGWALIEVRKITEFPAKSLSEVRPEIIEALRTQKREALLSAFISKVEDQIANGSSFEEVVKDNGLTIETPPPLLATGQSVEDQHYQPNADVAPLLKPVFDMEPDDDAQFVPILPQQRYALLALTDVIAPAPPPLDKVKKFVVQQYLLHEGAAKARPLANKLKAEIEKGMPFDTAIAKAGVVLPPVQKLSGRRADLLRGDKSPPAEIAILFAMAPGTIKIMPIPNEQGYFIIRLDKIHEADAAKVPGLVDKVRGDITNVVANEYGEQFERSVERSLNVKHDASIIARATQGLRRVNGVSTQ